MWYIFDDLAEDDVLPVEKLARRGGDEELAPIRPGARIRLRALRPSACICSGERTMESRPGPVCLTSKFSSCAMSAMKGAT